jgi:hypothetical protein
MLKKLIILCFPIAMFASCSSCNHGNSTDLLIPDSILFKEENQVSAEAMQNIVENISSPIEIAALIKNSGVPYTRSYLAPTDKVSQYSASFQHAFVLGIFGADLGYLNMYQKTSAMLDYLSAIKTLSDAIKIGQFFDFSTLKRLSTNNTNLDSLVYISLHNFNQMDKYLRENNRGSMSSLMISGAWIEGMYILTQVVKEKPTKELTDWVANQQVFLGDILSILKSYTRDPQYNDLYADFERIKEAYSGVSITYEQAEPEVVEQDGMQMIVQKDKTIINMSDETLKKIIETIADVRNSYLKVR